MRVGLITIISVAASFWGYACGGQSLQGKDQEPQAPLDAGVPDVSSDHASAPDVVDVAVVDEPPPDAGPDADGEVPPDAGPCLFDCWEQTSDSNMEGDREHPIAVRVGNQALFYGGHLDGLGSMTEIPGGALYDPSGNTWSPIADGPNYHERMPFAFTGTEILTLKWDELYSYSIAENTWLHRATAPRPFYDLVWTGTRAVAWGGGQSSTGICGGVYDPSVDEWTHIAPPDSSLCRYYPVVLSIGSKVFIWGGALTSQPDPWEALTTGAIWDPETNEWKAISTDGAPRLSFWARHAVWTGSKVIVWDVSAGSDPAVCVGALYDPELDTWQKMSDVGAACPYYLDVAWADDRMIVWSGASGEGAIYDPSLDTWTPMAKGPLVGWHSAMVWTGSELVVFGGHAGHDWGWIYRPPAKL